MYLGDTVTHQLLYISETPVAIISACMPPSLHLLKEVAEKIRHLLTNVTTLQVHLISANSGNPKIPPRPEQPKRSYPRDSDGFFQLHDISIAATTSSPQTV